MGLRHSYDGAAALRRVVETTDAVWELNRTEGQQVREILSPLQLQMLPPITAMIINARQKITFRFTLRD